MDELQELLIEAEDPYFELKIGGLRAVKGLFELRGVLAQLQFDIAKLDVNDDQLHKKHGSSATSGSKVKNRAVNKLKMRSKTGEVASVGLKINKICLWSFRNNPIRFLGKNRSKNHLR